MTSFKLYGFWRSSATWRVRIGLCYKGLDYDVQPVDLRKNGGEQHSEAYRALNPMRQVPLLEFEEGGRTHRLTQSLAILEYLEERYPEPRLLPAEPFLRVQARRLAEIVNAGIQPYQNTGTQQYVRATLERDVDAWIRHWIPLGLTALEAAAAESAGRFAVGDAVSIADACLVPQLWAARNFGLDLAPYPTLTRIDAACAELPAFQRAHAEQQPDAPRG
jgi:maleylpyruvate isomerase